MSGYKVRHSLTIAKVIRSRLHNMGEEVPQVRQYGTLSPQPTDVSRVLNTSHQQAQHVVPKFASFQAKQERTSEDQSKIHNGKSSSGHAAKQTVRHHREDDHPKRYEGSASSHRRHRQLPQHLLREDGKFDERSAHSDAIDSEEPSRTDIRDDFFVDRKGDPKNLAFGSLQKSAVANYRRSGAGNVLGSVNGRIDRTSSNDKVIVLSIDGLPERRGKNALSKASPGSLRKLRVRPEEARTSAEDRDADFLPLGRSRGRKRKRGDIQQDLDSLSDDGAQHYRSVQGKAKAVDQPEDEDLLYGSESSVPEHEGRVFGMDNMHRQKRSELSRAVENDPTNCENWVQLISFQDKIVGLDQTTENSKITNAEKQSNAEVKLSMYEKAVAAALHLKDKERLILAMMEEASQIWDGKKIQAQWRNILRDYPGSEKLWTRYLDFRVTTFLSFKYDDVLAEYIGCLRILKNSRSPKAATKDSQFNIATQPYLVLRLTLLMREAGFIERAVATWQALLEYHIFNTDKYRESQEVSSETAPEALSAFEEFWESEVPRIGEDSAQGWAKFTSRARELPPPKIDPILDIGNSSDIYSSFASLERRQTLHARSPGRTIDDVIEDDPFRVILFSDVRDILIDFPAIGQSQMSLVEALLAFCHLPPLHGTQSGDGARSIYREPFQRNDVLQLSGASMRSWRVQLFQQMAKASDVTDIPATSTPFDTPIADYIVSSDTLFPATGSWFSALDNWLLEYARDQGPIPIGWIRRVLKALVDIGVGGDTLAEYFLALELRLSPETVTKTAKKLIKARPTSFCLYNAHVCIDFRLGFPGKAEEIIVPAINTSKDLKESVQRDTIFLWRTWVWELLRAGQEKEALERLLSYSDPSVVNDRMKHANDVSKDLSVKPTTLLRTQQALTASRDHFLSLSLPMHTYLACDILILLAYLSSSRSLAAAQSAFSEHLTILSTRFPTTSSPHELLHQSFARLLHHHATNIPLFKPASIREALTRSIALFPQNTIFLSLYAWNESRFLIDDRVRSIVRDVVLPSNTLSPSRDDIKESVTPHFFAIYSELTRSVTFGSNSNTIRNTFERAVTSSAGAHCAALWKLYVLFEHGRGENVRAKAVWWRGVRACPWVKALWMTAFEELRDLMTDEELRGVWEMMGDKDLRRHIDLDEITDRVDRS